MVLRSQCFFGIQLEVLLQRIDSSRMVLACSGVIYHHSILTNQPVYKGLYIHRALSDLAVRDNQPGLDNIAGDNLCFKAGVDNLHIHSALCNLTALKMRALHLTDDGQHHLGNLHIVNAAVTVA